MVIVRVLQNQRLTRLAEEPSVTRQDSVSRSKLDSILFVLSVSITIIVMTATVKIPHAQPPRMDPFESLISFTESELRLPDLKLTVSKSQVRSQRSTYSTQLCQERCLTPPDFESIDNRINTITCN